MLIHLMEVNALEKLGLGEGYHVDSWEDLKREGFDGMKFGIVKAPLITKGKRKGRPNWRKQSDPHTAGRKDCWLRSPSDDCVGWSLPRRMRGR